MAETRAKQIQKYNVWWPIYMLPIAIELEMIRKGGQFRKRNGEIAGEGLFFHYKRFQELVWPEKKWHKWNKLLLEQFLENRMIGVVGPASSGKSFEAACFALVSYYAFPECTTVLVSSTEREMLEMRIWGEIKKAHRIAKERFPHLPGYLIESRQRIVTDSRDENADGRDFRNGLTGCACKRGGAFVGLGSFIGVKNKRLIHVADELQFMPNAFIDAIANLNKNQGFKGIGLGNPKDITDCLGRFCEPSAEIGHWDGNIDQAGGTKVWRTRFPNGICVQLVGSDSPNHDAPEGQPEPYPFLIGRKTIQDDIDFYGKDSLQFAMMDEGRFPRGQSQKRIITRQMCLKFGALEEAVWKSENRTRIGFMDAAYGSTGGDRCVFGELQFGPDATGRQILNLIGIMVVPISGQSPDLPEDQIANFVKDQCISRNIPPENFFFDSTGHGSLVAAFARLWSPSVQPMEFGGRPSDRQVSGEIYASCRDYYFNFRSELWFTSRLIIIAGQFRGMTEETMMEGCMAEWGLVSKNKTKVEPKEDTKLKVGRSPDLYDALIAGCEGARRRGFVIARLGTKSVQNTSDGWKRNLRTRMERLHASQRLSYKT